MQVSYPDGVNDVRKVCAAPRNENYLSGFSLISCWVKSNHMTGQTLIDMFVVCSQATGNSPALPSSFQRPLHEPSPQLIDKFFPEMNCFQPVCTEQVTVCYLEY